MESTIYSSFDIYEVNWRRIEAGREAPPFEPDPHAVYAKVKRGTDTRCYKLTELLTIWFLIFLSLFIYLFDNQTYSSVSTPIANPKLL